MPGRIQGKSTKIFSMKNLTKLLTLLLVQLAAFAYACEACKLQQPKVTQYLTHGTGPDGQLDWLIVAVIAVITLVTFYYLVKFLIIPGEKDKDHIKYSFLE